MVTSNKTIAKNTAFLYFRMLIVMVVTFFTARVILKSLGVEDYGIYNVVGGVVSFMTFMSGALSGSTSRFLTYELGKGSIDRVEKTFAASLNLHICVALLILLFGESIGLWFFYEKLVIPGERMEAAFWVYQFSLLTTMINITQAPYNAVIIAHENMSIYAYIGVYEAISKLIITFLIMFSPIDKLVFYALLLALNQVGIQLFYRYYTYRKYQECHFSIVRDVEFYKPLINYTGWELFGGVAFVSQNQGVNILLNLFFGPVVNTARAISIQIQSAVLMFSANILKAIQPSVVKSCSVRDYDRMYELTFISIKISYVIVLAMVLPIIFETKYILDIWLGDSYPEKTIIFTRLTLIYALINIVHTSQLMCVHAIGKIKYTSLIGGTLLILSLPISYLLFRIGCQPEVVLYALMFSTIGLHLVEIFVIHRYVPFSIINMIKIVYVPVIIISLLTLVFPYIIHTSVSEGILRLVYVILATEFILFPLSWYIIISKKYRSMILEILYRKFKHVQIYRNN